MKKIFIRILVLSISLEAFAVDTEKDLFLRAEARFEAGQYATALELYNDFIADFPLSDKVSDTQYRRAVCFVMLGQYDDGLSLLGRIQTSYRNTRFIRFLPFWTGIVMYHKKDYPKAIEALGAFLERKGSEKLNADALYYKALSEEKTGGRKEAGATLDELERRFPDFRGRPSVIVLRAYIFLTTGDYAGVIDYASKVDEKLLAKPELDALRFYKAEAYYNTKALDDASEIYESLFEKDSLKAADAFIRLFEIARSTSDVLKMEELMQKAKGMLSRDDPRALSAQTAMGIEYYKNGMYEPAKLALLEIWASRGAHPVDESIPVYLSESLVKLKDIQAAERILSDYAAEKKSASPRIKSRLGYVYILQKRYREALELLEGIYSQPQTAEPDYSAYYNLAYAYYKTGAGLKALEIVEKVTAQNKAQAVARNFFKLEIRVIEKTQGAAKALLVIRKYISLYPEDVRMRIELLKRLLAAKDYAAISKEAAEIRSKNRELERIDPHSYLLLSYLEGLSRIGAKSYQAASESLGLIKKESLDSVRLGALYPYALFYRGWALYKQADYKAAAALFGRVSDEYESSGLKARSLYLAGWCLYSANDFEGASLLFSSLADYKQDASLRDRGLFFKAKSLVNLKKQEDAKTSFKKLFTEIPGSELADDALFEYAGISSEQGKSEEAASSYLAIASSYSASPLAEDALFRRAEVYYTGKSYEKAKNAFYDYRIKYPGGKLLDASLYWAGLACFSLGEKSLAILLWEKIIAELRGSTYRAQAIIKTADFYTDTSEYSKALSLYSELITKYPHDAGVAGAEQKVGTLKYLVLGLGKKEAELVASVERNSRDKTAEGRKAIVELARLYMSEFGNDKLDLAYSMLLPLADRKDDIDASSDARYLVGEYFFIRKEYVKAGNEFLAAALLSTNNRDRMAHSIYRAAEMMKLGGNPQDAIDLVSRLEKNFPQSDWTLEGRKLVKGLK